MDLRELRKSNNLTQAEAALLIGVPYRTYIRYEEDENYKKSYKYKAFFEDLNNKLKIDEEHGVYTVERIKEILSPILDKHNIKYCYLFGSYAKEQAKPTSDIDLLVDTDITGLAFLKLIEEMRTSLSKKVDLLRLKDLEPGNPIVLDILKEGVRLI